MSAPTANSPAELPSFRDPRLPSQARAGLPTALATSPAGLVARTPVLWVADPFTDSGRGFWAKLEGFNPGGIKDRAALHMVSCARSRGALGEGGTIVESTSGTLGLGLALAGIVFGHPVTLVTDPGMEPVIRRLLAAHGTRVETVEEPHAVGGWQQARRDRVQAILDGSADASAGSFCPDQYNNPDNVEAYAPLGHELARQLGRVDVLVCSVGTGGHSAGASAALRSTYWPGLRLVGVDATGSTIFGQPARPRLMRGLGSSIYPSNVAYSAFDEVHWVAPGEAVWTCRRLASTNFATGGWSVGAVGLVASWVARVSAPGTRVAAIFPDGPYRYFDTVYNDDYCHRNGLLVAPPPLDPDVVGRADEREVLRWTRCTAVVDPRGTAEGQQEQRAAEAGRPGR